MPIPRFQARTTIAEAAPLVPSGLGLVLLGVLLVACGSVDIAGPVAHVRDGDTLEIGRQAVRLHGISAPERDAPGGSEARQALLRMVQGRVVSCTPTGERNHDRAIGRCRIGERDLGEALVRLGVARDCPRWSGGRYARAEREAGSLIALRHPLPDYCRTR